MKRFLLLLALVALSSAVGEAQERKGFWFRLDYQPGVSFKLRELDPEDLKGHSNIIHGGSLTAGYHLPQWSFGLGANKTWYNDPKDLSYVSIFLENRYHPFKGNLDPLSFNLRVGIPLENSKDYYKVTTDLSLSVSWNFRNKIWNVLGGEVSAGVGYMPYKVAHLRIEEKNTLPLQTIVIDSWSFTERIAFFLRIGLMIN